MTTRLLVASFASLLAAGGAADVSLRAGQAPVETGMLVGTVFLSSSRPAAGIEVAVWRGDYRRTTVSDETGEFELHDLPVGLYQWTATRNGERPQGLARDRIVIVWPDRIADWRIHLGGFSSAGEGTEAERTVRVAALDAAVSRWLVSRPAAYEFSLNLRCFCPLPREPVPYHVQGDRALPLADVSRGSFALSHYGTVEELFEVIAATMDRRPDEFSVSFDDTFGHPVAFEADPARHVFDEELGFEATDLEAAEPRSLAPNGTLAGTVRVGRSPQPGVAVIARRHHVERRVESDAAGRFTISGLPTGVYALAIESDNVELADPLWSAAVAFPGRTTEVNLPAVSRDRTAPVEAPLTPEAADARRSRLLRLEHGMDRWVGFAMGSYELEVQSRCLFGCGRLSLRVQGGVTESLMDPGAFGETTIRRFGSVERLFERVLEWIVRSPVTFQVTYHPVLGYPSAMTVEGSHSVSDDELSFEVLRFRAGR